MKCSNVQGQLHEARTVQMDRSLFGYTVAENKEYIASLPTQCCNVALEQGKNFIGSCCLRQKYVLLAHPLI